MQPTGRAIQKCKRAVTPPIRLDDLSAGAHSRSRNAVVAGRVRLSDESVPHALERWRQAERDEHAAHDDEATPGEVQESQEGVIEARDDYEQAAERARKRQAPSHQSSVAKLAPSGEKPRP
jgi:hypothetical protein